ncbi:MASE1 domain-containing protein [Rhodopila globiformis]|uniref:MASE1 domain-containing protein n=1 Tax=Rhodopila globiformis TaxID=1071 RepID=UPI001304C2AD|nr:MASE1 domain-containing protein [Rhodopila globiformis]
MKPSHRKRQPPASAEARAALAGSLPAAPMVVLFALVYLGAVLLGSGLSLRPSAAATVWPAAGVYLAALLLVPARGWMVLVAAAAAVQVPAAVLVLGRPPALAAGLAAASAGQAVAGAMLVRYLARKGAHGIAPGQRLRDTLILGCGALLAPAVGATLSAAAVSMVTSARFLPTWPMWWAAGVLGTLVVAPPVLAAARTGDQPDSAGATAGWAETILVFALAVAGGGFSFWQPGSPFHPTLPLLPPFLTFLPLIWAALRLAPVRAMLCAALLGLVATSGTALGFGAYAGLGLPPIKLAVLLQMYLFITAAVTQLLAATTAERRDAVAGLARANAGLEATVAARTAALADQAAAFRLALDAGDLGTWRWEIGQGSGSLIWDARCKVLFGLPPDAAVDYALWAGRIVPEDRAAAEAGVVRATDPTVADDDYVCAYRVRHPDGTVLWTAALGRAFFEPDPAAPGGRRVVRILGTIRDISAQRRADEARRAHEDLNRYLLGLAEHLRAASTGRDAVAAACLALGHALGAGRVSVGEWQPDDQHGLVVGEWRGDGMPAGTGQHRLADMGAAGLALLLRGQALVLDDVATDPRTANQLDAQRYFGTLGSRACLCVPLMRDGCLRAVLLAGDAAPRAWTDAQIVLARETLARTWQAVERLRADRALAESETRLRLATDIGQVGIFDYDLRRGEIHWDERLRAIWALPADVPVTMDIIRRGVHPDDAACQEELRAAALDPVTGGGYDTQYRIIGIGDGVERHVAAKGRVFFDAGQAVRVLGTVIDVTAQRAAEAVLARDKLELERLVADRTAALRATEARLAQAAKMEALGRLAGGIAHDFNNVLQTVQGSVGLASRRLASDPEAAERLLAMAADATERGAAVTSRLLSFSRRSELVATPVDAASLLKDLAQLLHHTLGPSVTLSVACRPGVPALLADAGQLEAVLVNLANNARDALPGGHGTITLGAEAAAARPGDLAAGDYVRLWIMDDGEGMSSDVLARVTEPFFTTKARGKGTGLGLAMAHGFAQQSGGALSIESRVGQGTTVSLWLPWAPADGAAAGVAAGPEQAPGRRRLAMLLVDDEDGVRTVLAEALADQGHAVTEAEDAASALARIDSGIAADVLVTDLSMPGSMDGLALIRETRRRRPRLPAVLITGHAGGAPPAALRDAVGGGPFAMVRKPASVTALEAEIAALLEVPA